MCLLKKTLNFEETIHVVFDEIELNNDQTNLTKLSNHMKKMYLDDESEDKINVNKRIHQSHETNIPDQSAR